MTYRKRLIGVREKLASFIGAKKTDEIDLVSNASMGINTILRNFEWEKDDQIIVCMFKKNLISLFTQSWFDVQNSFKKKQ